MSSQSHVASSLSPFSPPNRSSSARRLPSHRHFSLTLTLAVALTLTLAAVAAVGAQL